MTHIEILGHITLFPKSKILHNLKLLLNWVFPKKCLICSCEIDQDAIFCTECFKSITIISDPYCPSCGKILDSNFSEDIIQYCDSCFKRKKNFFDVGRSLFVYDKFSRKIIMHIKKHADETTAKICASLIYNKYPEIFNNIDYIIPVPSHISRILYRGFNPPSIFAKYLSIISNIPLKNNILKRIKRTPFQSTKNFQERMENVENAFTCKKNLENKNIIIVDDVFTTGSTINSCAKTLKNSGANIVRFLTIASTPQEHHSLKTE